MTGTLYRKHGTANLLRVNSNLTRSTDCCCGQPPPNACTTCTGGTIPSYLGLAISGMTGVCSSVNGSILLLPAANPCTLVTDCTYVYNYPSPIILGVDETGLYSLAGWIATIHAVPAPNSFWLVPNMRTTTTGPFCGDGNTLWISPSPSSDCMMLGGVLIDGANIHHGTFGNSGGHNCSGETCTMTLTAYA